MKNTLLIVLIVLLLLLMPPAKAETSISTINYSHHFDPCGIDCTYNEEHGGFFINHNGIVFGTYKNSYNEQSITLGIGHKLGSWHNIDSSVSLMLANNYKKDNNNWKGLMLIPAISIDWPVYKQLKWRTSYAFVVAFTGLKYTFK